jgi:4-hydroxybenzoate polyprenyltransferase
MSAPLDSAFPGWLSRLPPPWRPYALLARLDRPAGIWLLFLPCVMGLTFQRLRSGLHLTDVIWVILFFIGAVAMRGAGCTWNDISDRDIDAKVKRTAGRPLPSGQVTVQAAGLFLAFQLGIGFLIWLFLPTDAKLIALLALPLVAAYPFMKRVTWWPQAWLGATFNWGALVGAATATSVTVPALFLYVGLALWTVAYDTVYALQDREDDALIGVRSTARLFGKRAVLGAVSFHIGAAALIAAAAALNGSGRFGAVIALVFLAHGLWQAGRLKTSGEGAALAVFKSNVWAGGLLAVGFMLAAMLPEPRQKSLFADQEVITGNRADRYDLLFGLKLEKANPRDEIWFVSDLLRTLELEGIPVPQRRADPDAEEYSNRR